MIVRLGEEGADALNIPSRRIKLEQKNAMPVRDDTFCFSLVLQQD